MTSQHPDAEIVRRSLGQSVLGFYKQLPFNKPDTVSTLAAAVKSTDPVELYPCLAGLVEGGQILEVGCGVGWLSNSLSLRYQAEVLGIDFNPVAIEQAKAVASETGSLARFEVADVFDFSTSNRFSLVISLGVLHHTGDCHGAIRRICQNYLAHDGHLLLGLYHTYGRRPFLEHFEKMRRFGASESELRCEYSSLHNNRLDPVHLESWFRDQVLHPHETQHTYEEVLSLLRSLSVEIVSTSINKFGHISTHEEIVHMEKGLEAQSIRAIEEKRYYPGFFVVLARANT